MLWALKSSGGGSASGASVTVTLPSPLAENDVALLAIGQDVAGATVTSIVVDTGTGVFVQLAAIDATARSLALWLGYNFTGEPTDITITCSQSGFAYTRHHLATDLAWDSAPGVVASAGNNPGVASTAGDSNTLTPAVDDLLYAAIVMPSITADSTARIHTGNAFIHPATAEFSGTATRLESGIGVAGAAVPTKEEWTLASTQLWAAILAAVTAPAGTRDPTDAFVYKGRMTEDLDQAAEA